MFHNLKIFPVLNWQKNSYKMCLMFLQIDAANRDEIKIKPLYLFIIYLRRQTLTRLLYICTPLK